MNKLADYLYLFKSVIDEDTCKKIVSSHMAKSSWFEHGWTAYGAPETKREKELLNDYIDMGEGSEFGELLKDVLFKTMHAYADRYYQLTKFPSPVLNSFSLPRINRYVTGTSMSIHTDNITSLFKENAGSPILTTLIGLNSMKEYTGGELILFDDLQVELDVGDVLIFPSAFMYPHRVEEVKSGERWSAVSWGF